MTSSTQGWSNDANPVIGSPWRDTESMIELTNDAETLGSWVGRTQVLTDALRDGPARLMSQTLDQEESLTSGDRLPPLWHFIYFIESTRLGRLGRDGHPARGGFLPPVALPRRMWAGGRFTFHDDLHIGETAERTSTITKVAQKEGRTGPLCFVTVEHRHTVDGELRITEEQDLVYREDPTPDAPVIPPKPAPAMSDWKERVEPNEVLLFRYSALTFNGHRIHYDREYAREVEGYEGLVFHGPLTATLLAGLAESATSRRLATFSFRGAAPLFDNTPFHIGGVATDPGADLWAEMPNHAVAMTATATFR